MYVIDLQVSCKHHSFESVPIANGMRDAINNIKPTFHHGKNPAESHPPVVLGGELARFLKCWCLFIGYLYFFGNCHAIPGLVHQSQIHTLLDPRSISALVFFAWSKPHLKTIHYNEHFLPFRSTFCNGMGEPFTQRVALLPSTHSAPNVRDLQELESGRSPVGMPKWWPKWPMAQAVIPGLFSIMPWVEWWTQNFQMDLSHQSGSNDHGFWQLLQPQNSTMTIVFFLAMHRDSWQEIWHLENFFG